MVADEPGLVGTCSWSWYEVYGNPYVQWYCTGVGGNQMANTHQFIRRVSVAIGR